MCGPPEAPQLGSPATTWMRQRWEVFRGPQDRGQTDVSLEILLVRYRRRRPIAQNSDGCPNIAVLKLRIYCRQQGPFTLQRLLSARGPSPSNLRLHLGGFLHSRRGCAL